jgi:hypothetical protein
VTKAADARQKFDEFMAWSAFSHRRLLHEGCGVGKITTPVQKWALNIERA